MGQQELFVKMAMLGWDQNIKRTSELFNSFTDQEIYSEIAPGKNRIIYLLGHLAAVHDRMLPLLDLGPRFYPQLDEPFLSQPDKAVQDIPAPSALREYWNHTNELLHTKFNSLTAAQWMEKHTAMTDEDFAREPHRNKLSVLLNRTIHLSNHLGQLTLAKKG